MFGQMLSSPYVLGESMLSVSGTIRYLPYGLCILGIVIGFAIHGAEGGVLWSFVGYFLGKAIQSTFWTVGRSSPS